MAYQYPLNLRFRLIALAPQIEITDGAGQEILFVRQKIFNLREDVRIFRNSTMNEEVFRIKADRIIDFSAKYHITDSRSNRPIGALQHHGFQSIWKSSYDLEDGNGAARYHISEDNPWVKVVDTVVGMIPFADFFTGFFLNPTYTMSASETPIMKLTKKPAFFEGLFIIEKLDIDLSDEDEELALLGWLMMVQLERSRG